MLLEDKIDKEILADFTHLSLLCLTYVFLLDGTPDCLRVNIGLI